MREQNADYERGFALGKYVKAEREAGENPDPRWYFVDEAKRGTLTEFKRGFEAAMQIDSSGA